MTLTDPVGDVDPPSTDWFVPSIDITEFRATYLPDTDSMEFRIQFDDLRPLRHDGARYTHAINVRSNEFARDLYFERSAVFGSSLLSRTVRQIGPGGAEYEDCGTFATDLPSDSVLLTAPMKCLTLTRRPTKFTVSSHGEERIRARPSRGIGSDQLLATRRIRTR